MNISVLVLTCDRPSELASMLDDLANQSRSISQFVIVNNARAEEPTRSVVEQFGCRLISQVVYLRATPVYGTASGRNAGLGESFGDVVFLFDDDLRFPTRDYLDRVCRVFETDVLRSIGAVTTAAGVPTALDMTSRVRLKARGMVKRFFGLEASEGKVTRAGFQGGFPAISDADVDLFQGGVSAVRHEVAESLHFDEGFERHPFALSEDIEFGLQIRRRWRIRLLGDAIAINGHVGRSGTGSQWLDADERYELIVRNHDLINRRHRPGRLNRLAFWWAMVGVCAERLIALAVRQPRAGLAWRGFRRGMRGVLTGHRRIDPPNRTVERIVLGVPGHTGGESDATS